jgi:serine protease Do
MAMLIADQLLEHGQVVRAYLGVRLDSKFSTELAAQLGLPKKEGARVTSVTKNSPAELARILVGDVILEFDGTPIESDVHLINLVSLTPVNKEVNLRLLRAGRPLTLRLRVANRPPE